MAIAVDALGKLSRVLSALRRDARYAASSPTLAETREMHRGMAFSAVGSGHSAADDELDREWRYWWSLSVSF